MKNSSPIIWRLCLIILSLQAMADNTINQLYHSQIIKPKANLAQRIDAISAQFLGKPYLLGALGEGEQGYYDSSPLYRTDAFDCETYVDTVLALIISAGYTPPVKVGEVICRVIPANTPAVLARWMLVSPAVAR